MDLTKEQEEFLRENSARVPDLIDLTQQCFSRNDLDGRSREGRAVRKFLADNAIEYKTTNR